MKRPRTTKYILRYRSKDMHIRRDMCRWFFTQSKRKRSTMFPSRELMSQYPLENAASPLLLAAKLFFETILSVEMRRSASSMDAAIKLDLSCDTRARTLLSPHDTHYTTLGIKYCLSVTLHSGICQDAWLPHSSGMAVIDFFVPCHFTPCHRATDSSIVEKTMAMQVRDGDNIEPMPKDNRSLVLVCPLLRTTWM